MSEYRIKQLSNNGGWALVAAIMCGLAAGYAASAPVGWIVAGGMIFAYVAAETCWIWLSSGKDSP